MRKNLNIEKSHFNNKNNHGSNTNEILSIKKNNYKNDSLTKQSSTIGSKISSNKRSISFKIQRNTIDSSGNSKNKKNIKSILKNKFSNKNIMRRRGFSVNDKNYKNDIIVEKKEEDEDHGINEQDFIEFNNININTYNKNKMKYKNLKHNLKFRDMNSKQMISTDLLITNKDNLKNAISNKKKNKGKNNKDENIKRVLSRTFYRRSKFSENNMRARKTSFEAFRRVNNNNKNNIINNNLGNMRLKNKIINFAYTDEELQDMEFDEALHNDNRPFIRMYWSFLLEEHIILNTFFSPAYLDLRIIKLSFLTFYFEINFFLNAFFYTDDYISNAYHNDGVLDFVSSLPKTIYSFLVTLITSNLLRILSTHKKQFKHIIKEKLTKQEYLDAMNANLRILRNKLIIYYICIFIFGLFFLYYDSAFCAVYQSSQYYWLYGSLESLALDLVTPFIFCLILAGFRYYGLSKRSSFFYSLATFLMYIF